MKAMFIAKVKSIASWTLSLCFAAAGLAVLASHTFGGLGERGQPAIQRENKNLQNTHTETKTDQKKKDDKKDDPHSDKPAAFTAIHVKQGTVVIRQTGREFVGESRKDFQIENGTLILNGANPSVEFTVEVRELVKLQVDGVGKVSAVDLKGRKINVIVTRPATVVLAGAVDEQAIDVAAGATVDAQACQGKTAVLRIPAGGRAIVNISDHLIHDIAAGGTVEYFGAAKITDKVAAGATLIAREGKPAQPKIEPPASEPVDPKDQPAPKDQPLPKGAVVLTAEVDGYTQATEFNKQKYPFKYVGVSALDDVQLKSLSRPGDVPADTTKALLGCLLWPKQGDTLQKAAFKSDGKKLTGEAEVLHKYGKQGTHVLKVKLEGMIDDGRVTLKAVNAAVTGTWDSGFPVKLIGDAKITITAK